MEPRKATDVLLEMEAKLNNLIDLVKSQDLNIKVLSNKLNSLLEMQRQASINHAKPTIEAFDLKSKISENQIPISSESTLPLEQNPSGFRRTSRPETFSGDNSFLNKVDNKYPIQIPNQKQTPDIIVPQEVFNNDTEFVERAPNMIAPVQNSIPIIQRVVDSNGKSVFLADVEVLNSKNEKVQKSRTNGTGKWSASLMPGDYKVIIRKRDPVSKEKVEISQNISIDGKTSPLNLQMLIFR